MKLHAVPTPSFRGCSYTSRSYHRWVLSFIDPRGGHSVLERKCIDCGIRQHADDVPNDETRELPRTLWCLGDWQWRSGAVEP